MIYAIEEINNSSQSEAKIGYAMYDTCSDVSTAIDVTLKIEKKVCNNNNNISEEGPIKAVIGESSSEISVAVARLLALTGMLQVKKTV